MMPPEIERVLFTRNKTKKDGTWQYRVLVTIKNGLSVSEPVEFKPGGDWLVEEFLAAKVHEFAADLSKVSRCMTGEPKKAPKPVNTTAAEKELYQAIKDICERTGMTVDKYGNHVETVGMNAYHALAKALIKEGYRKP